MKKLISSPKKMIIVLSLLFVTSVGYSQLGVPGSPGGGGGEDVQDEAPISSLVVLGLAAGAVFGIRKLK